MVLTDITNRVLNSKKDHVKQMGRKETLQKENMLFSSRDFAEKLQKENMTLLKALAHERKRSELCSIEIQKLRINLRSVQENNLQLAQANSQMLAERNTNRARLKELQHELACKNASLKVKKQPEEHVQVEEQLKDSANVSDGDCKSFQVHDIVRKATKRKRTPRIRRNVKPIHLNEKATRFDVQETEQTHKFLEVEDAKETARLPLRRRSARLIKRRASGVIDTSVIPEETARLPLRRRSARLRSKEAEPCKSFHEGDEVRDTIKRRRLSSTKKSARFDFEVPEVTETLNADDARRASGVIDTTEQDQVQQNEKRRRRRQIELNTTDSEISSKGSSSNERNGEDVTEQITSSAQGKKDDCSSKDLYNSGGENMPLIEETEQPEEDQGKLEVGTDKVIDEVGASEDGERVPVENFQDAEDDKDDETAKDQTRVSTGPRKEGDVSSFLSMQESFSGKEQAQQRTTKVVADDARFVESSLYIFFLNPSNEIQRTTKVVADDARSLSLGTMSKAVEPSDSRYTTKETNQNRRSCLGTVSEAVEPSDSRYTTKETNQNRRSCLGTMSEAVEPSDSRYTTKETNQNRRAISNFESFSGKEQDQQRTTKVVAESKTVRDISFFKGDQKRKIFWTMEEEEMLKVGVEKFAAEVNKNIPWRKILKMGEEVFHKTRTPADLKDKWKRTW